jgi:hypothetical protein
VPPHSQHTGTPCTCFVRYMSMYGRQEKGSSQAVVGWVVCRGGGRTFLSESCSDGAAVCGASDLFSFGPPDAVRSGRCLSS